LLPIFAGTLRDKEAATARFWPTIAGYGLVLNSSPENVSEARGVGLKAALGGAWTDEMQRCRRGALYVIDMTFSAISVSTSTDSRASRRRR